MKAIIYEKYGPPEVLHLKEVEKPTPKDNEVLIKIHTTSVTIGDVIVRRGKHPTSKFQTIMLHLMLGLRTPKRKILGMELAGEVDAIGKDVQLFKKGDNVFASTEFKFGAYAEYKCLPEDGIIALKPDNLGFEEAAGGFASGGVTAWTVLRKANIQNGQKVLIYGASGSVGTFAVQLAKYLGAEVTGVDSTMKLDTLRSIGIDRVIDYTQENFADSGEKYDVILDVVGKRPFSDFKKSLKKDGLLLFANPKVSYLIRGKLSRIRVKAGTSRQKTEDLLYLRELIETGKLRSVIDKAYPLDQVVEAHKYVETGQKKGHVVISIESEK